ncbi:MAG: hypothetical protein EXQ58_02175 [Acidobacteria bacterium]|nr:hypothetical protein [Acidobacteriota bacterium]
MALVNSTNPIRRLHCSFLDLRAVALLAVAACHPVLGQDPKPVQEQTTEDRLSTAEEEFAYATKSPTGRVAAFLKIADPKMETAKRLHKGRSTEDMALSLRGYSSALQGAVVAVAWGQDLGANMQPQEAAIRKAIRRHADILSRLENALPPGAKPAILQARAALASAEVSQPLC